MRLGEEIELFQPKLPGFRQRIEAMEDADGTPIEAAPHPQQIVRIHMRQAVEPYAILRRDSQS